MTWQSDADNALDMVLTIFNHEPTWHQAEPPNQSQVVDGHVRHFASDETERVNAYGDQGAEIIVRATSFAAIPPPQQFDQFTHKGREYTVQMVRKVYGFENDLKFYRCFSRGN